MSQAAPAERLGFPRDWMVNLKSGKANLSMDRLFRLRHELGIAATLTDGRDRAQP